VVLLQPRHPVVPVTGTVTAMAATHHAAPAGTGPTGTPSAGRTTSGATRAGADHAARRPDARTDRWQSTLRGKGRGAAQPGESTRAEAAATRTAEAGRPAEAARARTAAQPAQTAGHAARQAGTGAARGRVGPLRTVAAGGTGAGQPTRAGWCGHVTRARCADATEAGYLAGPARCARPGRLEVRGTADAGRILPGTVRYVVHLGRVPGAQLVVRLLGVGGLVVEPALEVLPARDVAVEAAPDVLEVLVGERALRVPGYVRAHVVRLLLPLDVGDQPGRDLDRVHGLLQVLRAAGEPVRDALMVVGQRVEGG